MRPVEQRGPVFCVSPTAERNSIFQGDDVRSANTETGESRYSAAEVSWTFWPHIICCDTVLDNGSSWSIWQDARHRCTLCLKMFRRTAVPVKRTMLFDKRTTDCLFEEHIHNPILFCLPFSKKLKLFTSESILLNFLSLTRHGPNSPLLTDHKPEYSCPGSLYQISHRCKNTSHTGRSNHSFYF